MGLTVLDAGVVIAVLEQTDLHHDLAVAALARSRERGDSLVIPAPAYAECLVRPSRDGAEAVAIVDGFLDAVPIQVEPTTRIIAATAGSLRARHRRLRLPDALVMATAGVLGADRVLTTDAHWPSTGITVEVLDGQADDSP
jgi:predicted nucleic acid-binding protein